MQKTILLISRCVFLTVFIAISMGFIYWEAMNFTSDKTKGKLAELNNETVGAFSRPVQIKNANRSGEGGASVESQVKADDARPVIIKRYLEKYDSPLVPYSDLIFKLSQTYNFDYYWIVAIAQQESNLCKKIPEGSHNCWGYGINTKGTLKFDSYELALKSYAEYLKREYFDKGLNTPELIMRKYCPHSDGSWAYGVSRFIQQMENGDI